MTCRSILDFYHSYSDYDKCFLFFTIIGLLFLMTTPGFAQQSSDLAQNNVPDIPEDPFQAGLHYFALADYDEAIVYFRRSIEQNPEHIDSYYYLGFCYIYKGNEEYRNKKIRSAYNHYQTAYDISDNVIDLVKEKITKEGPSYEEYFRLGYIHEIRSSVPMVKEYDLAQEYYEKALEFAQPYLKGTVYLRIALLWYNQHKYEQAIKYLEEGYNITPKDLNLLYYLGLSYEKLNNKEKAIHYYSELIHIAPDTGLASMAQEAINKLEK